MKAFLHPNRIPAPLSSAFLHDQDPKRTFAAEVCCDAQHGRYVGSRSEDEPMRRREFLTILGSAALISPATGGAADAFPNRPTRLIIPHQ